MKIVCVEVHVRSINQRDTSFEVNCLDCSFSLVVLWGVRRCKIQPNPESVAFAFESDIVKARRVAIRPENGLVVDLVEAHDLHGRGADVAEVALGVEAPAEDPRRVASPRVLTSRAVATARSQQLRARG